MKENAWGIETHISLNMENTPKCGGETPGELAGNPQPRGLPSKRGWVSGYWEVSPESVVPAPWLQHPGASTLVAMEC